VAADPNRPNPWPTAGKLVAALLTVGVLTAGLAMPYIGGIGFVADKVAGKFLDTTCNLQESKPPQKSTIYARDGKTVIATLFSQDRVPIPIEEIPKYLQEALIATEDRRFYQHHGVDLRGLIRSAVSTGSGDTQGGSTLTMQYVKQMRYYQASEITDPVKQRKAQDAAIAVNIKRKMEDAQCALHFENALHESKQTILKNYLNIAFFGEHSYGIQTAAETYFNKPASQLSLAESALLVGMLRAPSAYDPFVNRQAALQRRNEVLQNLVSVGKLSQAAADKEKATPVALATHSPPQVKQGCASPSSVANAAFFCEYVQDWLENVNGIKSTTLQTGGLSIVTTLDARLQNSAQRHIDDRVPATSPMTAVMPVLDPKTGDVLAMVSSKHYGPGKGETEQPIFTKATANAASTYKLFPLLTALSTGVPDTWQLSTVGNFGQYKPTSCGDLGKHYKGVGNGDANVSYNTVETLRSATAKSSNTYFVALADKLLDCHLQPIVDIMTKLGIKSLQAHDTADNPKLTYAQNLVNNQRDQQLVLGSVPTSPLELAGAYAAVANNGKFNDPAPVLSIKDSDGNALPVKRSPGVQVLAPQVAAQAVQILTGDTKSQGTAASVFSSWYSGNQSVIAGKTGTNQAEPKETQNSSVWFVGMTPKMVATTAVINFDLPYAPSSGLKDENRGQAYGDFAARVWLDALKPSLQNDNWSWTDPQQVDGQQVTNVVGMSLSDAKQALAQQGFKLRELDAADNLTCPSTANLDTIGYYAPQKAKPGATITVCVSRGVPQYTPPKIVIKPKPKPKPTPGSGGGTTGGTGRGHGHGGGGPSPGPGH
jgi:membrane peptidoglycan carboxypeptidase